MPNKKYCILIGFLLQIFFVTKILSQKVSIKDSLEFDKLNKSFVYYYEKNSYDTALIYAKQLTIKCKSIWGVNHPAYAVALNAEANIFERIGKTNEAISLAEISLSIYRQTPNENLDYYTQQLVLLGNMYMKIERFKEANTIFQESINLHKKINDTSSLDYARDLTYLANALFKIKEYKVAESSYKEALSICKKILGEYHLSYVSSLDNLGDLYLYMANYTSSELLYKEALSIRKKILGENHPDYAINLNNLAGLYSNMGNYTAAELLYNVALDIQRKVIGEKHPHYAASVHNLAVLYKDMGNYSAAELLFKEALFIHKKVFGENHPDYATSLNSLASLYQSMGNYTAAETLYEEALTIRKKVLGENHPDYATILNNLAGLYLNTGKHIAAEPLYKEALNIRKKVLGENHPVYATSLNNLAQLYTIMGNHTSAEALYKEALIITKNVLGEKHPDYAISLDNLATLYSIMRNYIAAEPFYKEALIIRKNVLGENHPSYASSLKNLVTLYYNSKSISQWQSLIATTIYTEHNNQKLLIKNFSETEKETYLQENSVMQHIFQSMLHYFSTKNTGIFYKTFSAKQGWLLQGKQQLNNLANTSTNIAVKKLLSNWQATNTFYTKTIQLTAEKRKLNNINVDSLQEQSQTLEKQVIAALPALQSVITNNGFTGKEVAAKLKPKEAVVHWVSFQYKSPKQWTDSVLYAAYIITPTDTAPKFVTVFEEKQLQALLKKYHGGSGRSTIKKDNNNSNNDHALYQLIWQPLLPYLQGATTVYNLPSGLLHKISFVALTDSTNKSLLEQYELHQLLSINELVNPLQISIPAKTIALFGGANYNDVTNKISTNYVAAPPMYRNATNNKTIQFNYLKGTKTEVETIAANTKNTNWKVQTYTNTNASEDNFKNLSGENAPKILHIATHGFYFPPTKTKPTNFITEDKNTPKDFPLLRSGLVLSGANNYWGKDTLLENKEDGIVTAQEISTLNLLNTDLVVLSACQTALGDINGSEGVYGLQRAFKMAGVKKLLMSLWEVPDAETAELMQLFYTNIFKGESYYTAFRKAQLVLKAKYKDPTKWAGFVLVGE